MSRTYRRKKGDLPKDDSYFDWEVVGHKLIRYPGDEDFITRRRARFHSDAGWNHGNHNPGRYWKNYITTRAHRTEIKKRLHNAIKYDTFDEADLKFKKLENHHWWW